MKNRKRFQQELKTDIQGHLEEAAQLFAGMDSAYDAVAASLGFNCRGCEDNCCRSLFFHHTLVEYFWLRTGFQMLPDVQQDRIRNKAVEVLACQSEQGCRPCDDAPRPMCPLNIDGRCSLYARRPMICRLHGIPHKLIGPGGRVQSGPGCDAFYGSSNRKNADGQRLDRTPWYASLAQLEKQLRTRVGFNARLKMTIAQMILKEPPGLETSI